MAHIYPIDNKNLLFINPPKCATTAVDRFFQLYYEPANYRRLTFVEHPSGGGYDNPLRGHLTFRQIQELKKNTDSDSRYPAFWEKFSTIHYSFATIRNPWERMVSWYSFLTSKPLRTINSPVYWKNNSHILSMDFDNFVHMFCNLTEEDSLFKLRNHHLPQIEFLVDKDRTMRVDYLINCEDLSDNMNKMFKKFNISFPKINVIEKINTSRHRNYTEYYKDKETIELVESWESGILKYHDFKKPEVK